MASKESKIKDRPLKPGMVEDGADKDLLSQEEIQQGIRTFGRQDEPHRALETPDGKNDGALPAAYEGQQSNHP